MGIELITLVSGFMGKFDLNELDKLAGTVGRIYLLSYLLIMIFILVNFFITMLCTFLDAIKNDSSSVPSDHEVIEYIITTFKQFVRPDEETDDLKQRDKFSDTKSNDTEFNSDDTDSCDTEYNDTDSNDTNSRCR